MSWVEATFTNRAGKRQQVWVETADDGDLALADGRASIRYSEQDDAKVYNANPRNVKVTNGGAGPSTPTKSKSSAKKPPVVVDDSIWRTPHGERVIAHDVPVGLESEGLPPAGTLDAWTDGACTGNPGPCGYGVVLRLAEQYIEIGQYVGVGTNNIAELLAVGVALEELRDIDGKVRVHTDSSYAIGVLSKGWKAKANVELIRWIKELVAERDVSFVKVKGHSGIPLNERADRLAVAAVERRS